jgi:hypothetical protein
LQDLIFENCLTSVSNDTSGGVAGDERLEVEFRGQFRFYSFLPVTSTDGASITIGAMSITVNQISNRDTAIEIDSRGVRYYLFGIAIIGLSGFAVSEVNRTSFVGFVDGMPVNDAIHNRNTTNNAVFDRTRLAYSILLITATLHLHKPLVTHAWYVSPDDQHNTGGAALRRDLNDVVMRQISANGEAQA